MIKGEFASQRFAQRPQQSMLISPAGLVQHGEVTFTEKTGKYPIVADTDALQEQVKIQLPADFRVDELPGKIKLDSPFGKYEAAWVSESGAVIFTRRLEMNAQTVPAEKYAELKKFLDAVAGSARMPVVL